MPQRLLFKRDASPPSCAVRIVAEMIGLQMEYSEPDLLSLEHKTPEFRKMNPMGTIPVLQDGKFTVSESHAIIKYIVEKYGGDKRSVLYPADLEVRAKIDELLFFDGGVFFVHLKNVALPTLLRKSTGPTPQDLKDIEDAFHTLEIYLSSSPYLAGDHMTIADISVGTTASAIQVILPLDKEKFPKIAAWIERLETDSSFKKINTMGSEMFSNLLKIFWKKNAASQDK